MTSSLCCIRVSASKLPCCLAIVWLFAACAAAAEEPGADVRLPGTPPIYAVAKVSVPPKIDGTLKDEAWQAARPMGQFYLDTGNGPMRLRTVTRFVRDDTYLYMAVDCELPGASDKPIQKGTRNNVSFGGETVELFLDTDRDTPGYVQVIFDMGGAFTYIVNGNNDENGDIVAATTADKTGWRLEVRLKMSDLGGTGRVDRHVWGANVCRSSDEGSGSWADLHDTYQQPDAFGLLTFSNQVEVEDVGLGVFALPEASSAKVPVRLALRNPTDRPVACHAQFTAVDPKEALGPMDKAITIPPGGRIDVVECVDGVGTEAVRIQVMTEGGSTVPAFEAQLRVQRDGPAADRFQNDQVACALRPAGAVVSPGQDVAFYVLGQSLGAGKKLSGQVTVRNEAGKIVGQFATELDLGEGPDWKGFKLSPDKELPPGQYSVEWAVEGLGKPLRTYVCCNSMDRTWLANLVGPADAAAVLTKLKCPQPKDPADVAIIQARIDRLADRLEQQAAQPNTDQSENIRALFGQLMDLVSQVRDGQGYTDRQRGWFEYAIVSPVDNSAQPCSLFVPYDYDAHPERKYALEVPLHAGGGTHGGAGYRHGLDRDVTDRLILHPLSRGSGYAYVAGNDVINQVRDVMKRYRIDPDAVHIAGESLGGFGSFELPSVYPDIFASSRPVCGGGFDNPVEQMINVVTFVHHGLQDATVAALTSQVSVMQMQAEHCPVQLYLHDGAGHGVGFAARAITTWQTVSSIRRDANPRTVLLTGGLVQLKNAYWLSILRSQDIHRAPYLRASFVGPNRMALAERNVAWAKVSLPCRWVDPGLPLRISDGDGLRWTEITPGGTKAVYVHFEPGKLTATAEPPGDVEDATAYAGGGSAAMFALGRPVRVVYGTAGSTEQTEALAKLARDIRRWGWNGAEYSTGGYPILKDSELDAQTITTCDLILLGTPQTNSLLAKMADQLPVRVKDGQVTVHCDPAMAWPAQQVRWSLFYRNPLAPTQRIWWFGGVDDRKAFDAITLASCRMLGTNGPELVVQSKPEGKLLATALLDEGWQLSRPRPLQKANQVWPGVAEMFNELNDCYVKSFAVDMSMVTAPLSGNMLDWDQLTIGEALMLIPAGPMLRATVSGQTALDSRDLYIKRMSRRLPQALLPWAGARPEAVQPDSDYQVLSFPLASPLFQAQAAGKAVNACGLIPTEQLRAVQERYLRAKGVLSPSSP